MSLRKVRRIFLFYSMILSGMFTIFTGFVLYFWPRGPRSGQLIFLGFQKQFWQDVHTYVALAGVILITLHILENRNCVKMYVRETLKG
ncbi:DUF4405 domain-containing protein [Archaeoglobus neptunius]|uniref:DUF4405 domain-containing protein n=1 Tax=Archaeoglobus neptunius TaxID=2798580 RepID=UPI001928F9D0|nr:DUF4405 domain-containing protein [Archaeoglobus neptunius]